MMLRRVAALLLIVFCFGCAKKKGETPFKVEVVDGIKTVRNFRDASDAGIKLIPFDVDLSIGKEEGDEKYMFISPVDIDTDRDGHIFVLDSRDAVVKEYDPRGIFLRQFGRQGQGPGEFQSPSCLRVGGQGEIYVRDYNKIEVFSSRGEYRKTLAVDGGSKFDMIDQDALIAAKRTSGKDEAECISVGRFDLQDHGFRAFLSQRVYWPARIMDDEFVYEFPYFLAWGVDSKKHVYAASAAEYVISVFDAVGNLMFKFTRDDVPVPVAGEEMKEIETVTSRLPARAVENPFRARLVYPAFKSISIDEKDRVWVERYQPRWRKRINKETLFDVFSDGGVFLFTTAVPGHVSSQLKFRNGFVYDLMMNEVGYFSAVRFKMKE
jgi:hypothetical protein